MIGILRQCVEATFTEIQKWQSNDNYPPLFVIIINSEFMIKQFSWKWICNVYVSNHGIG